MAYASGSSAAAIEAAIANAIKASGVLVKVEPNDFLSILAKSDSRLVIVATGGIFKKNYQYLTSYKGFAFFTQSETQLIMPDKTEIIRSKQIWMPG